MDRATDDVLLLSYLHFFAISILYYDWTLTFDVEISSIWRRPMSMSAIFFVLNRYLSIIGNVFVTVFNFDAVSLQRSECPELWDTDFYTNVVFIGQLQAVWFVSPAATGSQSSIRLHAAHNAYMGVIWP
jgi:ABC-type transport system involved in multi-copper enzyme maturation permease subunit